MTIYKTRLDPQKLATELAHFTKSKHGERWTAAQWAYLPT
jgi:hypothetical protein